MKKTALLLTFILLVKLSFSAYIFIPMDKSQKNHLKAYGIAYWILQKEIEVDWLLNYRGGSFACNQDKRIESECALRGVTYELIADVQYSSILLEINEPEVNMDVVKLHKVPKIAIYAPPNFQPWDDAVTLALTYAEIPYDKIFDEQVLQGNLPLYDWLHLHHEDFTGQYGKFWVSMRAQKWYQDDQKMNEEIARKFGYNKVSQLKLSVAKKIRDYVAGGGYLFAMCSAPDSYDVALAAEGTDICDMVFDGDPMDPKAHSKLDYSQCFAFTDFSLSQNLYEVEISSIDATSTRPQNLNVNTDLFTLFDFSAKWDPVPTMLCQNHQKVINGFMGQTTAFNRKYLKSNVLVMGENKSLGEARYIHGEYGKGTWTFYGGHDPEDYQHFVGDPHTDLSLFPNSAGYRLILNNVLFPAAKKKKLKT